MAKDMLHGVIGMDGQICCTQMYHLQQKALYFVMCFLAVIIFVVIWLYYRFVDKAAVISTLKNGRVNDRKSNPNARPCPRYAIDVSTTSHRSSSCIQLELTEMM